jgi:Holliday junction resolvase RusA-like endonuclease
MTELRLSLPIPPSVNAAYYNIPGGGRGKSKILKAWLREAGWTARTQMPALHNGSVIFTGFVAVDVQMARPVQRDLDNCAKALLDLLTAMHVWGDDKQVHDLRLRWAAVEGCQVVITNLEINAAVAPGDDPLPRHRPKAPDTKPTGGLFRPVTSVKR